VCAGDAPGRPGDDLHGDGHRAAYADPHAYADTNADAAADADADAFLVAH
jgi:hypothetical protein